MFADIDLKEIAELNPPDRSFLSIYLQGPRSVQTLEEKIRKLSRALNKGNVEKDEQEYLEENYIQVRNYLKKNPLEHGSLCIFVCWLLDYFKAIPVSAPVNDCIWIDSSPYIRPLAELQDEYENVAVIVADNKKARIFTVTSAVAGSEEVIRGNVKESCAKGRVVTATL